MKYNYKPNLPKKRCATCKHRDLYDVKFGMCLYYCEIQKTDVCGDSICDRWEGIKED